MLRFSIFLLCLFLFVTRASAQIDFTPTVNKYLSHGEEYSSVSFKDEKRAISLEIPHRWTCRGDATKLQIVPPDQNFAEGVVQSAPTLPKRVFDESTLKALEAHVINNLPPGNQNPTVVKRQENTVILYQNLSYEFVVAYQILGQTFHRSVIFVNCPEAALIFRFTAPKTVFDGLNDKFSRCISSWTVTDPAPGTVAGMTASK